MPPPPLPLLLLLPLFLPSPATAQPPNACYPPPSIPCPPFPSLPPFPFSATPGCGHPAFQIRCAAPHSLISINSRPFFLLQHHPTSLLLLPSAADPAVSALLPRRPVDLSGSAFHLSPSTCSHLSSLRPCRRLRPSLLSLNCTGWQLRLLSRPLLLLKGCGNYSRSQIDRREGCQKNISGAIVGFLRSGIQVEWDPHTDPYFTNCSSCRTANSGTADCGFNDSDPLKPFLCFPSSAALRDPRSHNGSLLLATTLLGFICLSVLAVSGAAFLRRRGSSSEDGSGSEDPMASFLRRHHLQLQPPVYTYDQLRASTNGFDPRRKIGDGGFGSVYLAQLDDGRISAVKRLHRQHPATATKSFCNEILILSSIDHPNLVKLHGYCSDPRGLLLVYDYVPNGTLADHLHGCRSLYRKGSLTWQVRVDVALQTALALEYLHFSVKPPVVHRDITTSNIFIEKDMRIKVGDFGLSRLLSLPDPNSAAPGGLSSEYVCTGPQGTPGYLDPEYHRSFRLTEKSDVYSFGVVLLELVTGMKAVDLRRDKREVSLADMVVSKIQVGALHQVVDPVLVCHRQVMSTVEAVAELAFRCVAGDKDDRPDARELVAVLKRILDQTREPCRNV